MQEALLNRIKDEARGAPQEKRSLLLRQLSDLYAARHGRIADEQVALFVDVSIDLLATATLFERMAFANTLADVGEAPQRLVDHMLKDVYLVARPLIERGQLSQERLIELMDDDKRELTLMMIAQRPRTKVPVTDRLVSDGSVKVLVALASNTGAELSNAAFEKLGELAADNPDMDAALANRPDLPPSIARNLSRRVSKSAEQRLNAMLARDTAKKRNLVLR